MVDLFADMKKQKEEVSEIQVKKLSEAKATEVRSSQNILASNQIIQASDQVNRETQINAKKAFQELDQQTKGVTELHKKGVISETEYKAYDPMTEKLLDLYKKPKLVDQDKIQIKILETDLTQWLIKIRENVKTAEQKKWFDDQIKSSKERIKMINADLLGIGTRDNFTDFHTERLMEAVIYQTEIANQGKRLTEEQKMMEYVDKLTFIRESVKQISEVQKTGDKKKINETVDYVSNYEHETKELTNTMNSATMFAIITNTTKEDVRNTLIKKYKENTTIKLNNNEEINVKKDYYFSNVPVKQ